MVSTRGSEEHDMRIATTKGESSIEQVIDRLIPPDDKTTDRAQFRDQLLRANPHLADVGKLPPGTPILVNPPVAETPDARLESAFALAQQTLADTVAEIESALARDAAEIANRRALLESSLVVTVARENPELATKREETLARLTQAEEESAVFHRELSITVNQFRTVLKGARPPRDGQLPRPEPTRPGGPTRGQIEHETTDATPGRLQALEESQPPARKTAAKKRRR
jgi:hypothetical protein